MIKTLFILLFLFLFALAGVWLKQHDFVISGQYGDYLIETSAARLALGFFLFCFSFYLFLKFIFWIKDSPKRISNRIEKKKNEEGLQNLMKGFSALASGDIDYARKLSNRAEKELGNQSLIKLLKAQIAVIDNKPAEAEDIYGQLSKSEDAKFIGYRGLISQAIENKEMERALDLAEDLQKLNSGSEWINEAVIDLSFRNMDWQKAEEYTDKAKKNGSINNIEAKINYMLIYYLKGSDAYGSANYDLAAEHLKKSLKYNKCFIPSAILLAKVLMLLDKPAEAAKLIEKQWKIATHPELASLYEKIHEGLKQEKRLSKIRSLANKNKTAQQSLLIYARALIAKGDREKAKEILEKARKIRETESVCKLYGKVDKAIDWDRRADNAEEDKRWYCVQSGKIYDSWQLFSDEGYFNCIVWDYPQKSNDFASSTKNSDDKFLLIK